MLYGHLDGLRDRAQGRLAQTLRQTGGTPQARTERDVNAVMYTQRIAQLDAAENGLCFGRIDFHDAEPRYVGRMGIRDEADDYEPLLLDWRAPAARPFYLATPVSPDGVRRRRHIKTLRREVIRLDDEVLDLADAGRDGLADGLTGEAALLAALNASRTGQMSDIVETIQVEQDWIIRSPHKGVLVVQGGPGTGKTAVALHRAAFLLYTYREQLARRAVLVIGPNPTFLRYVGQVLPSLGETSVLMSTIADLYPGVTARRDEPAAAARVKGKLGMAKVIAAAVRARQGDRGPGWRSATSGTCCGSTGARATGSGTGPGAAGCRTTRPGGSRTACSSTPWPARWPTRSATTCWAAGTSSARRTIDDIRQELRESVQVRAALEEFWPRLAPDGLLTELLASPELLASAGRGLLTPEEQSALLRPSGGGWTPADVPLLDEAAELLGEDDRAARARNERERRRRIAYARGVLDLAYGSRSVDLNHGGRGGDPVRLRHPGRRTPGGPLRGRRRPHRGGTGGRGPDVGVRPHRGGRGAGALADGVADAHAALPGPVDDGGRGHGPGQ